MTTFNYGVAAEILKFFERNPEEELTYELLRQKFGITERSAHAAISRLVSENRLESIHVIRLPAKGKW